MRKFDICPKEEKSIEQFTHGYSLTEKGRDLLPVFYAISQWGMKYIP